MPDFVMNRNSQSNGQHEVHNLTEGCVHMPKLPNQVKLGNYETSKLAIAKAQSDWPIYKVSACQYCCQED